MNIHLKYLIVSMIYISSGLIAVAAFNYKIDNAGVFSSTNYLKNAAVDILDGNIVAGLNKNSNVRTLQEHLINNMDRDVDIVALGSSLTRQLRSSFVTRKLEFFNHAVSNGNLNDYISIIGIYKKNKGYIPKTVILGIDSWIFNKRNGEQGWKTLQTYYDFMLDEMDSERVESSKSKYEEMLLNIKQLFNYEYTLSNIDFLMSQINNEFKGYYLVDTIDTDDALIDTDGSLHYKKNERIGGSDQSFVFDNAISCGKKGVLTNFIDYDKLSNQELFEKFIEYLTSNGVEVIFLLPPYNPLTYDLIIKKNKFKVILDAEKYLTGLAKNKNIKIYGSYDAHKYGLTHEQFKDCNHTHEIAMKIIFSEYLTLH